MLEWVAISFSGRSSCLPVCVVFDFCHQWPIVFRAQSFASLSRFIPVYFILGVMVNMIVSLISLSNLFIVSIKEMQRISVR